MTGLSFAPSTPDRSRAAAGARCRLAVEPATIVVIAEHEERNPRVRETGVTRFTSSARRPSPDVLDPKLSWHGMLHAVIALNHALRAGADEALMRDAPRAIGFGVLRGDHGSRAVFTLQDALDGSRQQPAAAGASHPCDRRAGVPVCWVGAGSELTLM